MNNTQNTSGDGEPSACEKAQLEKQSRTVVRRWISGFILAGILAFAIPGVDAYFGFRPGIVSAGLFVAGFVVACYSFVRFGPRSGT